MLRRVGSILIVAALGGVVAAFVLTQSFTAWDFRNNLWGPAHLLVTGRDPYRVSVLFEWWTNAVWLPPAIGQFWWMGLLPESIASNLWFAGCGLAYVSCVLLILRRAHMPLLWTTAYLLAAVLFMPFITHMTLGQYSLVALVVLLLAFYGTERKQSVLAGMLCALALAKPQLVVLPLVGYGYDCLRRRAWCELLLFGAALCTTCAAFTIPLWIGYPGWVDSLRTALIINPEWQQPTLYTALGFAFGAPGIALAVAVALAAVIASLHFWRCEPDSAIAWSMALNLLVVPYIWSWDSVLLMPLFLHVAARSQERLTRVVLLLLFAGLWLFDVQLRLASDRNDGHFWWIPSAMIAICVLTGLFDKRILPVLSSRTLAQAETV